MRRDIHAFYDQLTDDERAFVDVLFDSRGPVFGVAKARNIPLAGDDRVERAVDALAKAIIESRKSDGPPVTVTYIDPPVPETKSLEEIAAAAEEEARIESIMQEKDYELEHMDRFEDSLERYDNDIDPALKAH